MTHDTSGLQSTAAWTSVTRRLGLSLVALQLAFLAACGGGDDPSAQAPAEASATIGVAGGTLNGPDGTQVVIPPQALTQDTLIRIARSSAGAPAGEPQGYLAQGAMYEFTLHGIVFERSVTMRIPVPPAVATPGPAAAFASSPTLPWHPVEATVADGFAQWPATVTGLSGVPAVSAGVDSTCAIHGAGNVACWGRLGFSTVPSAAALGASPDGSTSARASAQVVRLADKSALSGAVAVVAGSDFSCAQLTGGEVYCWGAHLFFQSRSTPQRIIKRRPDNSTTNFIVTVANPVVLAAAGRDHSCVPRSNGDVMCWGSNAFGQLGRGDTASSLVPASTTAGAAFWR